MKIPRSTAVPADRKPAPRPIQLPVLAELIGRGDGSYILKPKAPDRDLDTWISLRQAAELIGNVHNKSLYPLLGEYLVYKRPLPGRVVVSLRSVLALKQATDDVEFWGNPGLKKRFKEQVKAAMEKQTEKAMNASPYGRAD